MENFWELLEKGMGTEQETLTRHFGRVQSRTGRGRGKPLAEVHELGRGTGFCGRRYDIRNDEAGSGGQVDDGAGSEAPVVDGGGLKWW